MAAVVNRGDRPDIKVSAELTVRFDTNLEREAIDCIASGLAPLFDPGGCVPPNRVGLYLSSADVGIATSLRFWSEAQRTGLGSANPELFPWCLANAPAAALARRFGITGPNFSLIGEGDASATVLDLAGDDLGTERIDAAIVVALEMKSGCCRGLRLERA